MASKGASLAEEAVSGRATPDWLAEVHAALRRLWGRVDEVLGNPPDEDWRARFDTAVVEIGSNIVRHAYPPSEEKGNVSVRLRVLSDRIEAHFADAGVPYQPGQSALAGQVGRQGQAGHTEEAGQPAEAGQAGEADTTDLPNLADLEAVLALPEGGYGLSLVRASVDVVDYARTATGSNKWRLVKHLDRTHDG